MCAKTQGAPGSRRRGSGAARPASTPLRDADQARRHLQDLRDWGLSVECLAEMSGLSCTTIDRLLDRRPCTHQRRITAAVEEIVLALVADLDAVPPTRCVPAFPTARRLQALTCLGWSLTALARRLDTVERVVVGLRAEASPQVTARTARKVRDLYDELSMTAGPSARAAREATARGWLPPLAWDDIDERDGQLPVTEVQDQPDEAAVYRVMNGGLRQPARIVDRVEAIRRLTSQGASDAQAAEALGVTVRTVQRDRAAHQIPARKVAS